MEVAANNPSPMRKEFPFRFPVEVADKSPFVRVDASNSIRKTNSQGLARGWPTACSNQYRGRG